MNQFSELIINAALLNTGRPLVFFFAGENARQGIDVGVEASICVRSKCEYEVALSKLLYASVPSGGFLSAPESNSVTSGGRRPMPRSKKKLKNVKV